MAKKYYWLKLYKDFFQRREIKKLRRMPGGDTYTVIYLKLQLLSLQDGGRLYYNGVEDTFYEELALDIDEDPLSVQATLIFLKAKGLAEEESENTIMLVDVPKTTGSECESAERVRKLRESKRTEALQCNGDTLQSDGDVTACNTEKEKEIDIDKEKEKRDKRESKKKTKAVDFHKLLEESGLSDSVKSACLAFAEAREELKAPMTAAGFRLMLAKLRELAKTKEEMVDILNQSIINGWKGIFPLEHKNQPRMQTAQDRVAASLEASYDMMARWAGGDEGSDSEGEGRAV